jgi:acyl carrier protein
MSQTELLQTVEKTIRDVVNNQSLTVKAESRLVQDLGLESIDLLDVSSELENALGWELDFREVAEQAAKGTGTQVDMKNLRVQDLLDYISKHGNA